MKPRPTKKDKMIFWNGLSVGLVGGIVGNLWTNYLFRFSDNPNYIDLVGTLIFTIMFLGIIIFSNMQVRKTLK